jgi:hypothetical protein
MPWEMVVCVSLEDVCSRLYQVFNDLEMPSMCGQVESCPLLHAACDIQVENTFVMALLGEHLIDPANSLHALFLTLPRCDVNGCPVIKIFDVCACSMGYQKLAYVHTFLCIF